MKEAADPALYPSAFRIGLTTTKSSNQRPYVDAGGRQTVPVKGSFGMFFTTYGFFE